MELENANASKGLDYTINRTSKIWQNFENKIKLLSTVSSVTLNTTCGCSADGSNNINPALFKQANYFSYSLVIYSFIPKNQ